MSEGFFFTFPSVHCTAVLDDCCLLLQIFSLDFFRLFHQILESFESNFPRGSAISTFLNFRELIFFVQKVSVWRATFTRALLNWWILFIWQKSFHCFCTKSKCTTTGSSFIDGLHIPNSKISNPKSDVMEKCLTMGLDLIQHHQIYFLYILSHSPLLGQVKSALVLWIEA